jgi:hypothetical protein
MKLNRRKGINMTDKQILGTALKMACKFIRENPASDLDAYLKLGKETVFILSGGTERDPEGKEFAELFIAKAIEKIGKDEEVRE